MAPENSSDDAALRARLAALRNEINAQTPKAAPTAEARAQPGGDGFGPAVSMGLRAGSEFVAAILVGGAIGYGFDWLFHTKPLFIILFFLLGVAAGVLGVIRATTPKGGNFVASSRLSRPEADAKDVPRVTPRGGGDQEG